MGNDKKEKEEDGKEEKASEVPQSPGEKASGVPQSPGEKDSAVPQSPSSSSQISSSVFEELLESVIMDVASECHRIARLNLDCHLDDAEEELRLSEEARAWAADPSNAEEANRRKVVDVFGNTHPPVASGRTDCFYCGRLILVGLYARHLHRCMKKRKVPQNPDSSEIKQSKVSSTSHAATGSSTSHAESSAAPANKEANTRCGCSVSRCASRVCKCKKAGNPCTFACGCKNCENGKDDQPPSSGISGTSDTAIASV